MGTSETWTADFADRAARRAAKSDPDWSRGCELPSAVGRSLQKFQVGESGDGAYLMAKADAAGDTDYADAVRLFVAEEQDHARMLAALLHGPAHGGRDAADLRRRHDAVVRQRRRRGHGRSELVFQAEKPLRMTWAGVSHRMMA
ncbi:MAG: hypothetical protein AAGC80_23455 [Rhodococcus sp. (in: high G+C Gram-positive bacteria)]